MVHFKPIEYRFRATKLRYGRTSGFRSHPFRERNALVTAMDSLGLRGCRSWEKFIPMDYAFASVEQRIALLQGLFDTDGYVGGKGCPEFCTTSKRLASDVASLVQSLGGVARVTTKYPRYAYKGDHKSGRVAYRVACRMPSGIIPFRLARKAAAYRPREKYEALRYFDRVEEAGWRPMVCIAVDAADGLFIVDHCIPTHNTTITRAIASLAKGTVMLAAPTGRAAKRLAEATGKHAHTIHRLLRAQGGSDGWRFAHDETNPLASARRSAHHRRSLDARHALGRGVAWARARRRARAAWSATPISCPRSARATCWPI